MTRRSETMSADIFDRLFSAEDDPWRFRSSAYEADKYAATLEALTRSRYARALEVGCAIGVFTARLGPRCDRLLAIDGSSVALKAARIACADQPHILVEQRLVPAAFPPGWFDLIVLSEVLYYLTPADLMAVATCCATAQPDGGEVVLCHWLGETDYPQTGLEATERFVEALGARGYRRAMLNDQVYRLDRLLCP